MLELADVVVLEGADDAWEAVRREFSPLGLELRRHQAVDGWELPCAEMRPQLSLRAAYELDCARRFPFGWVHEGVPSRGAVGCYLSHLEVWRLAAARSRPTLVLEQDAAVTGDPGRLAAALAAVPAQADVALLGHFKAMIPFPFSLPARSGPGFVRLRPDCDVFGSHAYVVTPIGASRLVERALPVATQLDSFLRLNSHPDSGVEVYYHLPSLAHQRRGAGTEVQPRGHGWDTIRWGLMMAARAAFNGVRFTLSRARRRDRPRPHRSGGAPTG